MPVKFDQIQVRESEVKELEALMEIIPCAVKVGKLLYTSIHSADYYVLRAALTRAKEKSISFCKVGSAGQMSMTSHWYPTLPTLPRMALA
jgi:hypothetical protein